ncbi:hypothetical protein EYF80_018372 [Liparis tanakae]|uniref:Uncharacterized protein n=1 Tax=Liparis tanakae TaxID=230148 RepID=A0A4Z2I2F5_9TELE|nr:hypothetical protein EYF80_018372 [Liparis tanakae]
MVNLKIDWKVPKAACLVKLKRDKDKSVVLPPPTPVRHPDISEAGRAMAKDDDGGRGSGELRIFNI